MRTLTRRLVPVATAAAAAVAAATVATAAAPPAAADLTTPSRISCQDATLFGNYTPGVGHRDPITTLYRGDRVGFRYTTDDGNSAVVLWYQGGVWGYVLRSCVTVGAG